MNAPSTVFRCLAAAAFAMAATLAGAQATRTWVSGVGDDVNPCSRTAPCKTFAGAISKTAAGGEIDVLDPGGYGALTITKSITIDGGHGSGWASILNSGTTGIIINAAATDTIILRNIAINGAGTPRGIAGIRILNAGAVFIENCQIFGNGGGDPSGRGISEVRTNGGQLIIQDTIVRENSQSGIVIQSSTATGIDASLRNVHLTGNGNAGLAVLAGRVTVSNSVLSGNTNFGIAIEQPLATTIVFLGDSTLSDNHFGIFMGSGVPTLRMNNLIVTNNDIGVQPGGGTIFTFGNNKIGGNVSGNSPGTSPAVQQ